MKIKVLGACCKRSLDTFENTKKAVASLGLDAAVENVGDLSEIAKYGVMQTPALVVDDKVLVYGRFLTERAATEFLRKHLGI